jgi:predicted ATP-dependent serine protease
VRIDLKALVEECERVIYAQRGDGSPPMVALSADVVRAVAEFARNLAVRAISAKALIDMELCAHFAANGPSVRGAGATDACGSVAHPIHVSAVQQSRSKNPQGSWTDIQGSWTDIVSYNNARSKPTPLTEIPTIQALPWIATGIKPLDHLLGGGLVRRGSFMICGKRGTGKSTLLLQALSGARLPNRDPCRCLLASAEESEQIVTARARRLGVGMDNISVMHTASVDQILSRANSLLPEILVVDTIQTIAGATRQIQTSATPLLDFAHATGACVLLPLYCELEDVPDKLKHSIDVLLSLEISDVNPALRYLSVREKNRFGPANKTVCFEMRDVGLCPV